MRAKGIIFCLVLLAAGCFVIFKKKHTIRDSSPSISPVEESTPAEPKSVVAISDASPKTHTLPETAPKPAENFNHLQLIVQDEAGRPLPGAEVRTVMKGGKANPSVTNHNSTLTTIADGTAAVLWPAEKIQQLELTASKDDYASRKVIWDLTTGDVIPPIYTVNLKSGVHVGGIVLDPEGNPVPGATVSLGRFWRGGEERQTKGEEPAFSRQNHTTEADGRWAARNLPAELLERISVEGSHTNFIGVRVDMDAKPEIEQELRAGTHKLVLKRGLEVRGRVLNEQQQPIADAQVWAGRRFYRERQETRTDSLGQFFFRNINEGNVLFAVMAAGYAPDSKSHPVGPVTEEIVFQLAKGSVIHGVVQDESGAPVEGVRVVLEGGPGQPSYDHYAFSTKTGTDGRFEWNSAPNEPMPFYIGKTGYEQRRGVRLKPNEENVVSLRRNRQVQGQVLDADSGQPVRQFRIAVGRLTGDRFYSDSQSSKEFTSDEGLFTIDIHEENNHAIQASAEGYSEQAQSLPKAESGEIKVVLKLKPSKTLEGVVITAGGQPVAGASVALVDGGLGGRSVQFGNGRLRSSGSQTKIITTDASGRFSITSPSEAGKIVAADGAGFGSASIDEVRSSGVLLLQPFGRIEGILMRGGELGSGQELLISSRGDGISFQFETYKVTTDADGRFAFEKVPAGTFSIVRLVPTSSRSCRHSHAREVVVTSGETTRVALGGIEATLRGQVRFETEEKDLTLSAQLEMPRPQVPEGLTADERSAYVRSPEWQEQMKNRKFYSASVAKDGTLLLDSVAPGEYVLTVSAGRSDDSGFERKPVAQGETKVTVPTGADPSSPIEIGEVILKPTQTKK